MNTISIGGWNTRGGYYEHVTASSVDQAMQQLIKKIKEHPVHAEMFKQYSNKLSIYRRPEHSFERINYKEVEKITKKADRVINKQPEMEL